MISWIGGPQGHIMVNARFNLLSWVKGGRPCELVISRYRDSFGNCWHSLYEIFRVLHSARAVCGAYDLLRFEFGIYDVILAHDSTRSRLCDLVRSRHRPRRRDWSRAFRRTDYADEVYLGRIYNNRCNRIAFSLRLLHATRAEY